MERTAVLGRLLLLLPLAAGCPQRPNAPGPATDAGPVDVGAPAGGGEAPVDNGTASCPCPAGSYCDLATNRCVAGCATTMNCAAGEYCDAAVRMCQSGCDADAQCGPRRICDQHACVVGCRSCPSDDNVCTDDVCVDGMCAHVAAADLTNCSTPTSVTCACFGGMPYYAFDYCFCSSPGQCTYSYTGPGSSPATSCSCSSDGKSLIVDQSIHSCAFCTSQMGSAASLYRCYE